MTPNPFEEVEPLEPFDYTGAITSSLQRSIMWDLVGPGKMRKCPDKYGQTSASDEVLDAEYAEMLERKHSLLPFGDLLPLICYIAAESAAQAVMVSDKRYDEISDDDKLRFRQQTVSMGAAITDTVLGHLLQSGVLHFGVHR